MLAYILGFLDIATSFVLGTYALWGWFDNSVIFYHAAYVTGKGALFSPTDFASKVDVAAGIYMFLIALGIYSHPKLTLIAALWLLQKGLFSMISIIRKIA